MEETSSPSSSLNTFPQFKKLPVELRIQIWENALSDATAGRTIRVAIHYLALLTFHACSALGGHFCGKRKSCDEYERNPGDLDGVAFSMADGYFTTHDDFPDPVSHCAMQNLSLACRASREVVLSQYGRVLQINRYTECSGNVSRMVRYNPSTDLLLVTALQSPHLVYNRRPGSSSMAIDGTHSFTRDSSLFRDALSSFQHVAFLYSLGKGSINLMYEMDFMRFLFSLESLQRLYIWPDPSALPEAHTDGVILQDLRKFSQKPINYGNGYTYLSHLVFEAKGFLDGYERLAKIQRDRFAPCDDEWVPLPKPIESMGCYAPKSWVAKSTGNGNE